MQGAVQTAANDVALRFHLMLAIVGLEWAARLTCGASIKAICKYVPRMAKKAIVM